jgi:hypothetical protein
MASRKQGAAALRLYFYQELSCETLPVHLVVVHHSMHGLHIGA